MLVIGLTGGIASGKSLISRYLQEKGAAVIDADVLSRSMVEPGKPAWQEIRECFGDEILDERGFLDRKKLGNVVFRNSAAREKLNRIIHPKVIEATKTMIKRYREEKKVQTIVVDAPLLIEAGMISLVDKVWVVAVTEEIQLKRLIKRDRISREEAKNRISAQMSIADKIKHADKVIDNSGTVEETLKQVCSAWKELV